MVLLEKSLKVVTDMLYLNREALRDKIYACWLGKNIGGTLGTPFEGKREVLNVKGFNSEPGKPLPNDDLDLQLIWYLAVRERGRNINERILGEYWQDYITPFWNEYGICKANMTRGLVPPLSGAYKNEWKHSNGAWIRTEIWACLNPCLVDEALYYAYMDACVDHGNGDGTHAAIFVAAMESAAFIVSDIRELIKIGLSNIPEGCRMAKYIRTAVEGYDGGKTWLEVRNQIADMAISDPELGWFQAPANVAYVVIGLLYGEGDFKKTLLTAINCGDDTDCTGATAGSIMGIIHGTKIIPSDWKEYIGDEIVTVAINRGATWSIPTSCTALTDEIMKLHPMMLYRKPIYIVDSETNSEKFDFGRFISPPLSRQIRTYSDYMLHYESVTCDVFVEYEKEPDILPNSQMKFKLKILNKMNSQKHYEVKFIVPEGWSVVGNKNISVHTRANAQGVEEYTVTAGDLTQAQNRIVAEISCVGHSDIIYAPIMFLG